MIAFFTFKQFGKVRTSALDEDEKHRKEGKANLDHAWLSFSVARSALTCTFLRLQRSHRMTPFVSHAVLVFSIEFRIREEIDQANKRHARHSKLLRDVGVHEDGALVNIKPKRMTRLCIFITLL